MEITAGIAHFSSRLMFARGSVACGTNRLLAWTRAAIASLCLLLTEIYEWL